MPGIYFCLTFLKELHVNAAYILDEKIIISRLF